MRSDRDMDTTWFRRFGEPVPTAPRLVCMPHAGGSASVYAPLARQLSGALDVVAVQYPGRQDRRAEPAADSISGLAARIADRLAAMADDRPYALFGHSMGALVAYETARILRDGPTPSPTRLFLSGRGAPGPAPARHDRLKDDAEILAAVQNLGGTDTAVLDDRDMLDMVMPVLRADYGALASYRWQDGPVLNIPLTVLVGDADPVVPVASAAGWAQRTDQDNEVLVFSGGHFFLSERLHEVSTVVRSRLTAVTGGSSGIPGSGPIGGIAGGTSAGPGGPQAAGRARSAASPREPGGGDQRTAQRALA
ncbi:thioesterase II family protein [Streptomyces sp. NPDC059814]|uniref:thioesterase II family protein n=1 Tax=Streptomyces sp. NPDC059814 TaxID=3346959 RepID=UPI00365D03EF